MSHDFITLPIYINHVATVKQKKDKLLISPSVVNISELLKHYVYMYLNAYYLNIP